MENKPIQFMGKYPVEVWEFPATKGRGAWRVELWGNYKFRCTCPSFAFHGNKTCKHILGQREFIEDHYGSVYNYIQLKKNNEV